MKRIFISISILLFINTCFSVGKEFDQSKAQYISLINLLNPTTRGTGTGASCASPCVTTLAGSGSQDSVDGIGTSASFNSPFHVTVDSSGNVYVTENSQKIRKITSAGVVTTFAGSSTSGSTDATGTAASFKSPSGLAVDSSGNVYVADLGNHKIRKITSAGVVTTFAGSGIQGSVDATGTAASFFVPSGITIDTSGTLYVAEYGNNKIRMITSAGIVTTFAGSGTASSVDGIGTSASFNSPSHGTVDSSGNVYVTENSQKIRKITSAGVVTTFAGSITAGSTDATGTAASFNSPIGLAADSSGNVYVADLSNRKIRKITSAGVVTTLAILNNPNDVAIDSMGILYVADSGLHKIMKITQ